MRITAIQTYGSSRMISNKNRCQRARVSEPQTEPKSDSVAFKAHETVKGASIGTLLGLGTAVILSGGAAAPLIMAAYAAMTGAACGVLGKTIEDADKKEKND